MFLLVLVFITAGENKEKGPRHFLLANSISSLFFTGEKE